MQLPAVQTRSVEYNLVGYWFGRYFALDNRGVSRSFNRRLALERHWMTAGFAFGGFDTCRDFGFVDIVDFLAVGTGDFHFGKRFKGSGFRGLR